MSSGSTEGAHSRNTVREGGSSTAFSGALPACSVRAVGIFDDDDLPSSGSRAPRRGPHHVAHVRHRQAQALRDNVPNVGMRAVHHSHAGATYATPEIGFGWHLQRRGKALRRDRPTRSGWPGKQPRVGHRRPLSRTLIVVTCGIAEHRHRPAACSSRRREAINAPRAAARSSSTTPLWPTSRSKTLPRAPEWCASDTTGSPRVFNNCKARQ